MTANVPAQQEQAPQSPAAAQRARMDALMKAVDERSNMLVTLLKETGISFDRFREVLRRAIIKGQEKPETNLLLADAGSVIQACIDACTAGLLPDGKQGAIVIYNTNIAPRNQRKQYVKRAQFIPMYEGLLAIAYGSRNFQSIMAHVVYDVDDWDYELGVNPWIKHKPGARPAIPTDDEGKPLREPYKVVAAYAVAKTTNGGVFVEVFEPEDIRKVMAVSRAKSGPARDWPEQMARKGPLRRMWKFLPRDQRMDKVLELDDENYDLDALEVPEDAAQPALKRGFVAKPAAIEHREDEMVSVPMEEVRTEEPQHADAPSEAERGESPREMVAEEEAEAEPPADMGEEADQRPPRIQEFDQRLNGCTAWLNIKQALRSLYKAEDWERGDWERDALAWAWGRKREIEDRTDFVTDVYLFACWVCGADPAPDDVESNLAVLETQADWKKATPEIQDWARRIAGGEA